MKLQYDTLVEKAGVSILPVPGSMNRASGSLSLSKVKVGTSPPFANQSHPGTLAIHIPNRPARYYHQYPCISLVG